MIYLDSNHTLDELFKAHGAYVFNLALSITKRHDLAEDIAQEIFIKFLEKDIVFRNKNPRNLLTRMTYNHSLNVLKSQKTRQQYESNQKKTAETQLSFEDSEDQTIIRECLENLEDKLRIPVAMRYFGNLKLKEIAQELELPITTVQRRLDKGLSILRTKLKQKGFGALVPFLEDILAFKDFSVTWGENFIDQLEQKIATHQASISASTVAKFKVLSSIKVTAVSLLVISSIAISVIAINEDFNWNQPLKSFAQIMDFSDFEGGFQGWISGKLAFVNPFSERDPHQSSRNTSTQAENQDNKQYPNRGKSWDDPSQTELKDILDQDLQSFDRSLSSKKKERGSSSFSNKEKNLKQFKAKTLDPTKFSYDKNGDLIANSNPENLDIEFSEEDLEPLSDDEDKESSEDAAQEDDLENDGENLQEGDESEEDEQEDSEEDGEPSEDPSDDQGANEEEPPPLPASLKYSFSAAGCNFIPNVPSLFRQIYVNDGLFQSNLASESMAGVFANEHSNSSLISNNGQYVVFSSTATNLVDSDTNGDVRDIYVKNLNDGSITCVSVNSNGQQANKSSVLPSISADGRYISFLSLATNLDPDVTDASWNVYLHDRLLKTTVLVNRQDGENGNIVNLNYLFMLLDQSISASGQFVVFKYSNGYLVRDITQKTTKLITIPLLELHSASISADGRYISFYGSFLSVRYMYVRDQQDGVTYVAARNLSGDPVSFPSSTFTLPDLSTSNDGQRIVFQSNANDLVPNDKNGKEDVFVSYWNTETIERVSVSNSGMEANGDSFGPKISGNGRFVIFHSKATNLTDDSVDSKTHIYIRDLLTKKTYLASRSGNQLLNVPSFDLSISD